MTIEATCVDCNKVIAGFPAPGPGWAAICNACVRKRRVAPVGVVDLKHAPVPREEKDAAQRTLSEERYRELARLRKADADIRGAILQRRFAEGGSDIPATLSRMRHTFEAHSTQALVGWALRRMHSFQKDRDYWRVEHRRVRDEKEAARRDAVDWEKAAKGASAAASSMEARYTSAAGERDAYKRKFEIEQATANDLRAQLSAKTSELTEALNAANENRRGVAAANQDRDAWKSSADDLQKLCRRVRENLEPAPSSVSLYELAARTRHALREATKGWQEEAERRTKALGLATGERDAALSNVGRLQALLQEIHGTLDPKGETFETFLNRAVRVRKRAWDEEHAPPSGSSPTGRSNPR